MADWPHCTIEDIAAPQKSALATGPFGSTIGAKTFRSSGVPVIRGSNLSADVGKRLIEDDFVFLDETLAQQFDRSVARLGDLVFTCWGTTNQVGLIDENASFDRYIVSNKQMKLTPDTEKVYPLFLYYFFSSPIGQQKIAMGAIGSSVPGFNLTSLRKITVPIPPLTVQKRIIEILGCLDDKIAANRRTSQILDAMARALFKDWFVDFGPTRAKDEGRAPYLPVEVWSLFPGRLDEEGNPEGWATRRIDDILDLAYGKALPAASRLPGEYPVYGSGGVTGFHNEALVLAPSIIVGRKGTVGSLYWEDRPCFPIDTVFYVVPKSSPLTFCYYLLRSLGLETMNTDAAVPGLNRSNVYRLKGPWAVADLASQFDAVVQPIRDRMFAADCESRSLAALRDLLLPGLISGEIRIRDAEKAGGGIV